MVKPHGNEADSRNATLRDYRIELNPPVCCDAALPGIIVAAAIYPSDLTEGKQVEPELCQADNVYQGEVSSRVQLESPPLAWRTSFPGTQGVAAYSPESPYCCVHPNICARFQLKSRGASLFPPLGESRKKGNPSPGGYRRRIEPPT
jgi:hypothetical protein